MKVFLYSITDCPWCEKARALLKKNKVKFKEFNVAKSRTAANSMISKSGQTGTPVLDINGKIIIGFNESLILKSLKK